MTELKPCPFCGSENIELIKEDTGHICYACQICTAAGPLVDPSNPKFDINKIRYLTDEEAAKEAWNTRKGEVNGDKC